MDSLIIYFLPTILALGIVTSYEDVKEGKIRNRYLLAAFIVSIIMHIILLLAGILPLKYIGLISIYSFFTLIIGFFIWQIGWWGPADAKLICVFIMLIPITAYKNATTMFPPLDMIINSVIPIFLFLLVELIIKTNKDQKIHALKYTFNYKRLGTSMLAVFTISWLNIYLLSYLGIKNDYLINILLIMVIFGAIRKIFKELTLPLLGVTAILRIFLNTNYILSKHFIISFIITASIFIVIFSFLRFLAKNAVKKVYVHQLKPGMMLSEGITKQGTPKDVGFSKKDFAFYKDTPLDRKDIYQIRNLHSKGKLHFNTIRVHHTTPLAPFIFLGTILTIICEGNAIVFIRSMAGL